MRRIGEAEEHLSMWQRDILIESQKTLWMDMNLEITGDAEQGYAVTNTRMPSLTVQKKVEGKLGDKTKQFEIKIRLADKDGNPVTGSYGGVEFDSHGEAVV